MAGKKGKSLSTQPGMFGVGTAAGIPVTPYFVMILSIGLIAVVIVGHIVAHMFGGSSNPTMN
ncbi:hypothetical protein CL6EHI_027570 [Entamoeba histolytica]|uniref:Uncharacterized protein n=4 Tax=Entamoeba histolytica TaxID=5759 RepID=B1N3E0_ENTH1|nr:hypothetical protein EHI_027570 [Entamoeba histolytica HM-1:IMSS]XP_656362.1 hypothetical protein EHI_153540 [Entamoeba histolytica HM-1:IMSS]GAT91611.1 hypothetical protein CL6EHI_153540 [Entamoeba histolytica]EAL50979.1 hypothetical protein EHI_153540 [Entamoeba histolytica HM-1:IMSS]EDS89518.1 hypothetical protein EHI_027570 [Entamoeba histolytica HM-1:IMSS]GAT95211.1 hypothetical protein CL6EHI_027570 [Entamoeba histolytica]|eukprot:XP_001913706.1 hypothetical protein EHI_027570 [Entamoeba histolytica HM-1:IMSS]